MQDIEILKDPGEYSEYKINTTSVLSRRSARLNPITVRLADSERRVKDYETFTKKLSEFSDEDEIDNQMDIRERTPHRERKLSLSILKKLYYSLCILIYPFIFLFFYIVCNESHCSFKKLPDLRRFKSISTYFDLMSLLVITGYAIIIALFSVLPFGGRKVTGLLNKMGKLTYVMNGLFTTIILFFMTFGLQIYGIPVTNYVMENYLKLYMSSTLLGILLAIFLYIKSFYVSVGNLNPNGMTSNWIFNFWIGRECCPRIMGILDFKMYLLRYYCIGVVSIIL